MNCKCGFEITEDIRADIRTEWHDFDGDLQLELQFNCPDCNEVFYIFMEADIFCQN